MQKADLWISMILNKLTFINLPLVDGFQQAYFDRMSGDEDKELSNLNIIKIASSRKKSGRKVQGCNQ